MSEENKIEEVVSIGVTSHKDHSNPRFNQLTNNYSHLSSGSAVLNIPKRPTRGPNTDRGGFRRLTVEPFQVKIMESILRKKDIFVNVSPSGGKTAPIVRIWEQLLTKSTNRQSIPKIVWVCPNRMLGSQLEKLAFEFFDSLRDKSLPGLLQNDFAKNINRNNLNISSIQQSLTSFGNSLMSIDMDVAGARPFKNQNEIISICTWNKATNIISKMNPRIIVIDEVQERFKVDIDDENQKRQSEEQLKALIDNIKAAPKTASIVLLTGSVNNNILDPVMKYMNKKFGRNFEAVIAPVANRASLQVYPTSNITKFQDKLKLVKDQIKGRSTNNLIAIFSSDVIMSLCDQLIKDLPERDPYYVAGAKIHRPQMHRQQMPYNQMLHNAIENIKGKEGSPEWLAGNLEQMLNKHDKKGNSRNDHLAKCLLRGFGYIKAIKVNGVRGEMYGDDLKVVEQLFMQGKISTIFATTMAGVGVNLKVTNIFIPTLQIYPGKYISDSDIIQLVHRAGRSDKVAANIFCHPDDVAKITDATKASPNLADVTDIKSRLSQFDLFDPRGEWNTIKNMFINLFSGKRQ